MTQRRGESVAAGLALIGVGLCLVVTRFPAATHAQMFVDPHSGLDLNFTGSACLRCNGTDPHLPAWAEGMVCATIACAMKWSVNHTIDLLSGSYNEPHNFPLAFDESMATGKPWVIRGYHGVPSDGIVFEVANLSNPDLRRAGAMFSYASPLVRQEFTLSGVTLNVPSFMIALRVVRGASPRFDHLTVRVNGPFLLDDQSPISVTDINSYLSLTYSTVLVSTTAFRLAALINITAGASGEIIESEINGGRSSSTKMAIIISTDGSDASVNRSMSLLIANSSIYDYGGGALSIDAEQASIELSVFISGVRIERNGALGTQSARYGAILVSNQPVVATAPPGGAVNLAIERTTIAYNVGSRNGALMVFAFTPMVITINESTILQNLGGAIETAPFTDLVGKMVSAANPQLIMTGGELAFNNANFGSAINQGAGTVFLQNVAIHDNGGGARGGAIFVSSPFGLHMTGGRLTGNSARDRGAAIEAECSRLCRIRLSNVLFDQNAVEAISSANAGVVVADYNSMVFIDNCTVTCINYPPQYTCVGTYGEQQIIVNGESVCRSGNTDVPGCVANKGVIIAMSVGAVVIALASLGSLYLCHRPKRLRHAGVGRPPTNLSPRDAAAAANAAAARERVHDRLSAAAAAMNDGGGDDEQMGSAVGAADDDPHTAAAAREYANEPTITRQSSQRSQHRSRTRSGEQHPAPAPVVIPRLALGTPSPSTSAAPGPVVITAPVSEHYPDHKS